MADVPTMHKIAAAVIALYGLVSIVGGLLGYAKSPISLAAGGGAGLLLLLCAIGVFRSSVWSLAGAIVLALLLLGRFTFTVIENRDNLSDFFATRLGMTSIALIVGGVLVVIVSGLALMTARRPPTSP